MALCFIKAGFFFFFPFSLSSMFYGFVISTRESWSVPAVDVLSVVWTWRATHLVERTWKWKEQSFCWTGRTKHTHLELWYFIFFFLCGLFSGLIFTFSILNWNWTNWKLDLELWNLNRFFFLSLWVQIVNCETEFDIPCLKTEFLTWSVCNTDSEIYVSNLNFSISRELNYCLTLFIWV